MSRLGNLLGFGGNSAPSGLGYDLGPSEPIPGRHVTPSIDQANTERIPPFSSTGTINWDGYLVPSEYNSDLTGFTALDVYERMRRSDPSVRETLWHMKGPIVNAEWQIDAPDDATESEREQAEFARAAFFEWLEQPWTEVIEHALSYLDFGHSVFEPVFQVVERELTVRTPVSDGEPVTAEGDEGETAASLTPNATKNVVAIPIPLPPDNDMKVLPARKFTTWRKFSPRLPRTIWRWNHDEYGELTSITQTVYVNLADGSQGYRVVEIPAGNLVVLTHDKWGDEFTGISLLRSAYKPWVMKEMLEKIASIAYERHGVGYLVGYMPRDLGNDQSAQDALLSTLQTMRQDAVAVFPGPKQEGGGSGNQSYLVEILTPPGGIPNFEPMLMYYRGEIAGAMLARFKELGHASTGARATADVQSAVWYNALHAVARYLESHFNVALRRLIDLNYTGVSRYPKLKASGIEARNLLEFSQSVALLVDAKMLTPDAKTRGWVRQMIDAPNEDADEARAMAVYEQQMLQAGMDAAAPPGGQSPTDKLKATSSSRGVETDGGENAGRPRTENAK